MKIQIWSDIACPFCYIGKHRLEKALSQFEQKEQVEIEWKSFQLDPTLPIDESLPLTTYLVETKGISSIQAQNMFAQVAMMGQEDGLVFNFNELKIANTFRIHQIVQFAKTKGIGSVAKETLFKAYFSDNREFWDIQVLKSLAQEIGLEQDEVEEIIKQNLYADKIHADINEAKAIGIRGVPFFLFDNKYALSGAQPVNAFIDTLNKLTDEK